MPRTYYCANCLNSFQRDGEICPNLGCQEARPPGGWGHFLGPGDLFDRHYLIDQRIAVGGAGMCYRAFETDSDGEATGPALAIKVLYTSRDSGPYLRRLAAEAQILQDLAHPHIVECRGFVNRLGHNPYLITLFEEGGNLHEHVRHVGAVPIAVAATITRQILLALNVAHQRGVVHRDLKPQNVLIRTHVKRAEIPHALVADFGIAKVSGTLHEGLTQVGTFVGTPEFAAPEQFLGEPPGAPTDVFAVGGLLFFLLTGRPPVRFTHRSDSTTSLSELLAQTPPKTPESTGTPEECAALDALLAGMMNPKMSARWTVQQIVAFLGRFDESLPLRGKTDTLPLTGEIHTLVAKDFEHADETRVPTEHPTMSPAALGMKEDTPAPRSPRMRLQKDPMSLDDLFGGSTTEDKSTDSRSDLSLDDLFAAPTVELPTAPPPPQPAPAKPIPKPEPIPEWEPTEPQDLPSDLPDDTIELLQLLGSVQSADRPVVSAALDGRGDLSAKLNGYRPGSDARLGRGIGLAVAISGWTSMAQASRRMLVDPDAGVRACAAQAIGAIGSASMLTGLRALVSDPEAEVRAAAARALAAAGVSQGRQSLVRGWLAPLQTDADRAVQATWKMAVDHLE